MTDAPLTQRRGAPASPQGLLRWRGGALDLALALLVAVLAGVGYLVLPDGAPLRIILSLGVLFFVPGYLLIEAATAPSRQAADRAAKAWVALGASPAIVGLLALSTAMLPGGFRAQSIVAMTTVACFGLASIAFWRRAAEARMAATSRALAPA